MIFILVISRKTARDYTFVTSTFCTTLPAVEFLEERKTLLEKRTDSVLGYISYKWTTLCCTKSHRIGWLLTMHLSTINLNRNCNRKMYNNIGSTFIFRRRRALLLNIECAQFAEKCLEFWYMCDFPSLF